MNEKYIRKLIALVEESEIESLEISHWGRKVKITQRINGQSPAPAVVQPVVQREVAAPVHAAPQAPAQEKAPVADTSKLVAVKSPMVGTFYAAPAPDADPYVSLNERIRVNQVVCIVEAMKLMNEIESEVAGRVVEILAENAQPVEFGQTLFLIDPE